MMRILNYVEPEFLIKIIPLKIPGIAAYPMYSIIRNKKRILPTEHPIYYGFIAAVAVQVVVMIILDSYPDLGALYFASFAILGLTATGLYRVANKGREKRETESS